MGAHDIMHGSQAWARIANGVPLDITDKAMRQMLHDYAQVVTVLVDRLNRVLDEVDLSKVEADKAVATARRDAEKAIELARHAADLEISKLHIRVDNRGREHEKLRDELMDPREGILPTQERQAKAYTDKKTGVMTAVQIGVLAAIAGSTVMFALVSKAAS